VVAIECYCLHMPAEYTADDARAFIASTRWRYASTMPWAPHFYTRKVDSTDKAAWMAFARFVWRMGKDMHWRGGTSRVSRYWDEGGYMYFAGNEDEDVLVNRARILDLDPRTPA
jgi:hypothetical protein